MTTFRPYETLCQVSEIGKYILGYFFIFEVFPISHVFSHVNSNCNLAKNELQNDLLYQTLQLRHEIKGLFFLLGFIEHNIQWGKRYFSICCLISILEVKFCFFTCGLESEFRDRFTSKSWDKNHVRTCVFAFFRNFGF